MPAALHCAPGVGISAFGGDLLVGQGDQREHFLTNHVLTDFDALCLEISGNLAEHILVARFHKVRRNDFGRIGSGGFTFETQQLGGPEAQKLVAARFRAELLLRVKGEFGFLPLLAIVEPAHGLSRLAV